MEQNELFSFTYSAVEQKEIEAIRKKYLPMEENQENKLEQLRRLHSIPSKKAQRVSLIIGILGTLLLGTGMSLIMTKLGAVLGNDSMVLGIAVGVLGIVLIALAYPVYNRTLKKGRQRIAPEILRLTDELLN